MDEHNARYFLAKDAFCLECGGVDHVRIEDCPHLTEPEKRRWTKAFIAGFGRGRLSAKESAKIHTARERARIVGIIDDANHVFTEGARFVSVDAIKTRIDQQAD